MFNIAVWLVVGVLAGWMGSLLMESESERNVLVNVVGGVAGAALGGLLIAPLIGAPDFSNGVISVASLVVALLGAVIVLAIVHGMRRGDTGAPEE